jgi:hypothetical protein
MLEIETTFVDSGLDEEVKTARMNYVGLSSYAGSELLTSRECGQLQPRRRAVKFLETSLASGPMLKSAVLSQAEAEGIPERTLRRAKLAVGVESHKGLTANAPWSWALPEKNTEMEPYDG